MEEMLSEFGPEKAYSLYSVSSNNPAGPSAE